MDPDFTKAFPIDYLFEEVQKVNVAVYDIDNNTPKLNDDDFLGQIECTLGQVCIFFVLVILGLIDYIDCWSYNPGLALGKNIL